MIRFFFFTVLGLCANLAIAETVVPVRTIRADAIITELDVQLKPGAISGSFESALDVIGQEARTTLYAGRPIRFDDVGPPALVTRNQVVSLKFKSSGLIISTEGRSLERGAVGDVVRVMNLNSRATLFGQVRKDGSVQVYN